MVKQNGRFSASLMHKSYFETGLHNRQNYFVAEHFAGGVSSEESALTLIYRDWAEHKGMF